MDLSKVNSDSVNLLLMQLCLKLSKAFSLDESSKNPVVKLFLQNAAPFLKFFDFLPPSLKDLSLINKNLQYFKSDQIDGEVKIFFEGRIGLDSSFSKSFNQSSSDLLQNDHENINSEQTFKNQNDYPVLNDRPTKILKEIQSLMRFFQKEPFFVKQECIDKQVNGQNFLKQQNSSFKFTPTHPLLLSKNQQIPEGKGVQNMKDPVSFIKENPLSNNPSFGVVSFYEHQKNLESKKRRVKKKKNFQYATSLEYLDEKEEEEKPSH